MIRRNSLLVANILAAVALDRALAQDTTTIERTFILEGRVGASGGIGGSRSLLKPDAATGVTFAFQLSRHWWGWTSADYRSDGGSIGWGGDGTPAVELYTLTGGVARTFGLPFLPSRWRPFEIGVGIGSTQSEIVTTADLSAARIWPTSEDPSIPADAVFEPVYGTRLWSSSRWLPTLAGRLRMAAPLGALRLSVTAGLQATYVGDVQLWDGGWESTGDGSLYRPTSKVWSFGTLLTVPITVGLGFRF